MRFARGASCHYQCFIILVSPYTNNPEAKAHTLKAYCDEGTVDPVAPPDPLGRPPPPPPRCPGSLGFRFQVQGFSVFWFRIDVRIKSFTTTHPGSCSGCSCVHGSHASPLPEICLRTSTRIRVLPPHHRRIAQILETPIPKILPPPHACNHFMLLLLLRLAAVVVAVVTTAATPSSPSTTTLSLVRAGASSCERRLGGKLGMA